ncbi:hypothetical protein [Sporichthya sp.]|nr:hypothetical protein [Sporichthya sp.]
MKPSGRRWRWRDVLLAAIFVVLAVLAIVLGWNVGDAPEGN